MHTNAQLVSRKSATRKLHAHQSLPYLSTEEYQYNTVLAPTAAATYI